MIGSNTITPEIYVVDGNFFGVGSTKRDEFYPAHIRLLFISQRCQRKIKRLPAGSIQLETCQLCVIQVYFRIDSCNCRPDVKMDICHRAYIQTFVCSVIETIFGNDCICAIIIFAPSYIRHLRLHRRIGCIYQEVVAANILLGINCSRPVILDKVMRQSRLIFVGINRADEPCVVCGHRSSWHSWCCVAYLSGRCIRSVCNGYRELIANACRETFDVLIGGFSSSTGHLNICACTSITSGLVVDNICQQCSHIIRSRKSQTNGCSAERSCHRSRQNRCFVVCTCCIPLDKVCIWESSKLHRSSSLLIEYNIFATRIIKCDCSKVRSCKSNICTSVSSVIYRPACCGEGCCSRFPVHMRQGEVEVIIRTCYLIISRTFHQNLIGIGGWIRNGQIENCAPSRIYNLRTTILCAVCLKVSNKCGIGSYCCNICC